VSAAVEAMTSEYATKEEVAALTNLIKTLRNDLDNRISRSEKMLEKIIDVLNQKSFDSGRALCFAKIQAGIDIEESGGEARLMATGCMLMHECGRESGHKGLHQCARCSFLWGWVVRPST